MYPTCEGKEASPKAATEDLTRFCLFRVLAAEILDPCFLMDLPLVWAHDGTLYMAKKEVVKLGWESDSQSSKKLKGKVLKAGGIGLDLSGGGACSGLRTCR